MSKGVENKIQEVVQRIVQESVPEKVLLFGSWAWGEPDPDSDVDLLVVQRSERKKIERQRELRSKLFPIGLALDLLVYTPEEIEQRLEMNDPFVGKIMNQGKILYAK